MKKHSHYVNKRKYNMMYITSVLSITFLLYFLLKESAKNVQAEFYNPLSDVIVVEKEILVDRPDENIDSWIAKYSKEYATTEKPESYLKYQLHCLANKESGHRYSDHTKCGDNGKSCGLYQWREESWKIMRKKMGASIGSLWNNKEAIETTAYALTHGYDNWWGPLMRGSCR